MNRIVGAGVESLLNFAVLPFKAMQSSSYEVSYAPNYKGERGSEGVNDCSTVQVKADWPFYTSRVWLGDAGVEGAEPGHQFENFGDKWEFMQGGRRVSSVPPAGDSNMQVTLVKRLHFTPQQTTGTTYFLQPCPPVPGPGNTPSGVRQKTTPPCPLPEKWIRETAVGV